MHPLAALFALLLAGAPYTCSWIFVGGVPASSSSCQPPQVTFSRPGTKRITLTVCAGTLCDSTTQTIQVVEARPRILRIDSDPRPAYDDEPVTLSAEVSGRPPISYSWKLPDGSTLSGNPIVISPERLSPSSPRVRLTVSNDQGNASSVVSPKILPPSPRIRSIALSTSAVYPGSSVTASVEATGRPPLTFRWTFPDGKILEGPSVSWTAPELPARSYRVTVQVSNRSGSATSQKSLRLLAPVAIRAFEPDCPGPCIFRVGQRVRFSISSSVPLPNLEVDWNGDGIYEETLSTLTPDHVYSAPGFYRPRLRARLPNGRLEIRSSSRSLTITR